MISEPDETRTRDGSRLALALLASALINLFAWVLAIWSTGLQFHVPAVRQPREREYIVTSSSLRIEHRVVPQPPRPVTPPHPAQAPQNPRVARMHPKRATKQGRPAERHEVARTVAAATPQPRRTTRDHGSPTLAQQLAQEQVAFQREAQQLHEQRAPISIATMAPRPPSTFQRTFMDLNGRTPRESVEALLQPIPGKHWIANGMSCYYVHYYAQFSGGGNEDGNIPWPICYPADHDAMLPLDHPHELPIPYPPVGFTLPPGTPLGPLLHSIYTHTIH